MKRIALGAAAVLFILWSGSAFAQNAGVSGTVSDPSNALIPGVSITATNSQTGVVTTVITNETGTYNLIGLQPGVYKITAELPGFKTSAYNNYQVGASEQLRLNFTLQVGAAAGERVEVVVDATTLLTNSSSSIGQVLTERKVQDLPIVGEDALSFIAIMPGVQGENFAGVNSSSVNTVRDGLSVSDGRFANGVFATTVINPDLVGEMRLILTPVDAELGRGSGQVQITTRSGTNRFTGSAGPTIGTWMRPQAYGVRRCRTGRTTINTPSVPADRSAKTRPSSLPSGTSRSTISGNSSTAAS